MPNVLKKVAVVVPNWNGENMISACIDSLLDQSLSVGIIVVENGSIDRSMDILQQYGDTITTLPQKENLGFAGGVNVGITYALAQGYEYICLLNNDAVATKEWAEKLYSVMDNDETIGIVTSRIMSSDGSKIDSTGDYYTRWGLPYPRGRGRDAAEVTYPSGEVFGASGGASMYRAKMLHEIGLFDEVFFAYFEDVDISYRARLYGWSIYYCKDALVYHAISATSNRIRGFAIYHTMKNYPLVFLKNTPLPLFVSSFIPTALAYSGLLLVAIKKGNGKYALGGFFRSITLIPGSMIKRHKIQKNRSVSSKDMAQWITYDVPEEQTGILRLKRLLRR